MRFSFRVEVGAGDELKSCVIENDEQLISRAAPREGRRWGIRGMRVVVENANPAWLLIKSLKPWFRRWRASSSTGDDGHYRAISSMSALRELNASSLLGTQDRVGERTERVEGGRMKPFSRRGMLILACKKKEF